MASKIMEIFVTLIITFFSQCIIFITAITVITSSLLLPSFRIHYRVDVRNSSGTRDNLQPRLQSLAHAALIDHYEAVAVTMRENNVIFLR